jgi:DNA repair protein RadD
VISEILNKIDLDDLVNSIGSDRLRQIKILVTPVDAVFTKDEIIKCILSLYGYDLLSEKRIRQLIFYAIEHEKLQYLASKYCKKSYEKAYDNSLELSVLPWKYGSEFVTEVADILELPKKYLPSETEDLPTTFEVNPFSKFYPLHDYQENLKDKIVHELLSDNNRFLIQMPTGAGKTRTVLQSIIQYSKIKKIIEEGKMILWLAHTEELCEQALSTFSNLWPHLSQDSITVHRCYGNNSISLADSKGSFIVGTLQKFTSFLNNDSYFLKSLKSNLKIVIIDEAHKSTAKTYSILIDFLLKNSDCKLIGATATPGRNAQNMKANIELADFYNGKLLAPSFSDNPIAELRNKGVLSFLQHKIIESKIDIYFNESESKAIQTNGDFSSITLKKLGENANRNNLIIKTIEDEILKTKSCLVFTCSVEHAQILNAALNYKNYSSLSLDSNTSRVRRKNIIDEFKNGKCNVLFNYGILSTGFDAPNVRSIIITRPTSSVVLYSQMIGRGLRGPKMGGARECNLIDIKDNFKSFGGVEEVYDIFEDYWK